MSGIQKSTLDFLDRLSKNNNREWFADHKDEYKKALEDIKSFAGRVEAALKMHDHIEETKIYRIYRDIRFSKDKTPYKSYFAMSFRRATAALRGGCYVSVEPDGTYVAGGFWNPKTADLTRIRQELDFDDKTLRKILKSEKIKRNFGNLEGEELKTAPRGFSTDHKAIDLLRKKQFLLTRKLSRTMTTSDQLVNEVNETFRSMRPFFNYMSEVLTTDLNGESIL